MQRKARGKNLFIRGKKSRKRTRRTKGAMWGSGALKKFSKGEEGVKSLNSLEKRHKGKKHQRKKVAGGAMP